jgi:hypothetical protein
MYECHVFTFVLSDVRRWGTLMGEVRSSYKILVGKYQGKNHLQNLGIDGKQYENGPRGKKTVSGGDGFNWIRTGPNGGRF